LASVKPISIQVVPSATKSAGLSQRWRLVGESFFSALKYFLLVPLFPLLGYYLLDQTGVSQWLITVGVIPGQILGEGFGHVGLCFSIHYLFNGLREIGKALLTFVR
jgi:hypothetical protein